MIIENWPNFNASGKFLSAAYSLNFFRDLDHSIPLTGSWQGDSVKVRTAYIDNYENTFALNASYGNTDTIIPANTAAYINLDGLDYLNVTSPFPCFVNVKITNQLIQPGFVARGNAPARGFDSFFNKVLALYHFEGVNGQTITEDFSPNNTSGDLTMVLPSSISDRYGKFGNTCGLFLWDGRVEATNEKLIAIPSKFCIEWWMSVDTLNANHQLFTLGPLNVGITNSGANFYMTAGPGNTSVATTAKNATYAQFYHFVVQVNNGQLQVGANGVVGGGGAFGGYVGNANLIFNAAAQSNTGPGTEGYYMDDMRLTGDVRYDLSGANYPIPTGQFLDN